MNPATTVEDPADGATAREDDGAAAEVRELGEQPLAGLMRRRGLTRHALVAASPRPITHKLVKRAETGRRLTPHSKALVVAAFNAAAGGDCLSEKDLFSY